MEQRTYKLRDFAQDISVAVKDAQSHHLDKFVGLEHYDSGEPVITRYTDTNLITSSVKEFHKNDILIARRNVYLKRAGIAFFDGLTSGDSIILRIFDDCDAKTGIPKEDAIKIIPFVLNSNDFWAYANKHADGMNSKRISKEMLYDYEFSLPNLTEIRQLYSKLWAAYNLKESYKKLLLATDEIVKSQFIEMFGNIEDSRSLCQICRPKQWPTIPTKDFTEDGYLVYGANGVIGHYSEFNHEYPTILMACRGASCGAINISQPNSYITGNAMCMDEIIPEVSFEYLAYFLSNYDYKTIITGGAQPQITYTNLKKVMVPIPPYSEQLNFALIYQQADKSKFELRKSIEAIDAVIKSLINS